MVVRVRSRCGREAACRPGSGCRLGRAAPAPARAPGHQPQQRAPRPPGAAQRPLPPAPSAARGPAAPHLLAQRQLQPLVVRQQRQRGAVQQRPQHAAALERLPRRQLDRQQQLHAHAAAAAKGRGQLGLRYGGGHRAAALLQVSEHARHLGGQQPGLAGQLQRALLLRGREGGRASGRAQEGGPGGCRGPRCRAGAAGWPGRQAGPGRRRQARHTPHLRSRPRA